MTRVFLILAALAGPALAEPGSPLRAGDLEISGGFARATLPRAPVAGAYVTLRNTGAQDDRLTGATTPAAAGVQIHAMTHRDGVAAMQPLPDGLPIPAGTTTTLNPGGLHLMLTGLTAPLVAGQSLDMVLRFEQAGEVALRLPVLPTAARGPADGGH